MSNSLYNLTISNNNEINNLKKYISNISNNINNLKLKFNNLSYFDYTLVNEDKSITPNNYYYKQEEKINNIINSNFFKLLSEKLSITENMKLTDKFDEKLFLLWPNTMNGLFNYYLTNNKKNIYEISVPINQITLNIKNIRPRIIYGEFSTNILDMIKYNVRFLIGNNNNYYYFIDIRNNGIMLFKEKWINNEIQQIYSKFYLYDNTDEIFTNDLSNNEKAYKINNTKNISCEWIINYIKSYNNIEKHYSTFGINLNEYNISNDIKIPTKYINQKYSYNSITPTGEIVGYVEIILNEDNLELSSYSNINDKTGVGFFYIIGYKEINNNIQVLVNETTIQPTFLGSQVNSPGNFRTFIFDFDKKEHYLTYNAFLLIDQLNLITIYDSYFPFIKYFKSDDANNSLIYGLNIKLDINPLLIKWN